MTREEVIRGLKKLHENYGWVAVHDCDCKTCPYERVNGCYKQIIADALALLKAQEPRVMTLEEVKAFEWDCCYLEQERQPGKEYRMIAGDYALTCITWPSITSMRIEHGDNSYGVKWRCWTSRPDEKTREATPWDAQGQRDYEAAVEMAEYCERYEPTYNADDGSM